MNPFRALGLRPAGPPKPRREEFALADLSTRSARESGGISFDALSVAPPRSYWTPLSGPVPGRLVTGSLSPEHRAKFLLRLPKDWNGGLVVSASPGFTDEHGYDLYWSDFLINEGYAFACMDKGVHTTADGDSFFIPMDGTTSIRHWLRRFQELAAQACEESAQHYGRVPERTYAVGVSNGGYLVRRLLEESPELAHGGVDVSGVLWRPERNLLISLPRMLRDGLPVDPAWEQALAVYRGLYWTSSLAVFIADLDPAYEGPLEGYDLSRRPAQVRAAIAEISNTGRPGKPLVSLSGGKDFLITAQDHAQPYAELAATGGRHRLVLVDDATHVDGDQALIPAAQPLMPHAHAAFRRLVKQVEGLSPGPA
ncbi:MAG: hypothetical protein NTY77_11950 [Elusimicrobia bacterium]|nr:hypothetical protein [Elusimicrobiota bacterium]